MRHKGSGRLWTVVEKIRRKVKRAKKKAVGPIDWTSIHPKKVEDLLAPQLFITAQIV